MTSYMIMSRPLLKMVKFPKSRAWSYIIHMLKPILLVRVLEIRADITIILRIHTAGNRRHYGNVIKLMTPN